MLRAQIKSIAYYLPNMILTNEELSRIFPEWSPEQIVNKTGISNRHIAAPEETAADLAYHAAIKLFASNNCAPEDIDFLLLCTQSPDYFLPTTACILQHRLGLPPSCGALDFNLGCSGFIYGLALAKGIIEAGMARRVLLLTAETYSKHMNPRDKSVRTIFGDAAAATFLHGVESVLPSEELLGPFVFGTDGSGAESLIVRAGGFRRELSVSFANTPNDDNRNYLYMDGPAIFSFTLKVVPAMIGKILEKNNLNIADIDLFVFHQANKFMLDALRKQMKIPSDRFVVDMADTGNTVSATIPIALKKSMEKGILRPGMRVMLVGYGVGLSWGAALATWTGE